MKPGGNIFAGSYPHSRVYTMPASNRYEIIRSAILQQLAAGLRSDLFYHSIHHTIDVEQQATRIAGELGCTEPEIFLLKLACLYHDSGFLFTYTNHEEAGCQLAIKELPAFGIHPQELAVICGMIRATRIPQTPHNQLEEIICDADLDYLGRADFFPISHQLYQELQARQLVANENAWNTIQVNFFKQHSYFTPVSKALRAGVKQQHLAAIASKLPAGG